MSESVGESAIEYFRRLAADGNADFELPEHIFQAGFLQATEYHGRKRFIFDVDASDVERFPELAKVERVIIVGDAEGKP